MTPKDGFDLPPFDTATDFSGEESGSGWEQRRINALAAWECRVPNPDEWV